MSSREINIYNSLRIVMKVNDKIKASQSFLVPDEVRENLQVNFQELDLWHKTSNELFYKNTNSKNIPLDLVTFAYSEDEYEKDVSNKVNFIEAFSYPDVSPAGALLGMPVAYLTFGKRFVNIRGIIKDFSVAWGSSFNNRNFYKVARITFNFTHVPIDKITLDTKNHLTLDKVLNRRV